MSPTAVLFDLDDTLSDHLASMRAGVLELRRRYDDVIGGEAADDVVARYSELLEDTHRQLLAGEMTQDQARITRVQRFFATWDLEMSEAEAEAEYRAFRVAYEAAVQVVPGTHELLERLRGESVRMGVITNNLVVEQHAKLDRLDLRHYFEMLAISEEVGVVKPDPHIFHVALDRMGLGVDDVVMVGDSLTNDIAGALGVGMRCVWLDRHRVGPGAAPDGVQAVIAGDLSDHDAAFEAIVRT